MKFIDERLSRFLTIVIIVLSLIPVFAIGIYDHPSADDYGYSMRLYKLLSSQQVGIVDVLRCAWETSMHYMNTWQGLYTAAFLLALQPAVFNERLYMLTVFIIIISCTVGVSCLTYSIRKYILNSNEKGTGFISIVLIFYMIQGMPVPSEGLYWYNGAVNYLFFWGMMLIYVALLLRYRANEKAYCSLLAAAVLGFLLSGGNHITAFIGILFSLTFVVNAIYMKKGYLIAVSAVSEIFGFIINVTSPGTAIRAAQDGTKSSVIKTVIRCGFEAMVANSKYITLSLVLVCLISIPAILRIISASKNRKIFTIRNLINILVADFTVISAMYCVPYYAMGVFGEGRVEDTIYMTYSLLFLLTFAFFIGVVDKNGYVTSFVCKLKNGKYAGFVSILMIASVGYVALVGNALGDYSTGMNAVIEMTDGSAKRYHEQNMERLEKFTAKDTEIVVVDNFEHKPLLLYFNDMSVNPSDWPNTIIEEYYGKKEISRKKTSIDN